MKLNLKVYRGYANDNQIVIFGHVFKKHAPDDYRLDKRWYKHAWSVFRMFLIKTVPRARVKVSFRNIERAAQTDENGFFNIKVPHNLQLEKGWHTCSVHLLEPGKNIIHHTEFFKPARREYAVISDIDDTFLVSHSRNIFKKLYILLTKNIHKRHYFREVITHHRFFNQLEESGVAFFYVSSSEWNLYNFIYRFTILHNFPKAVLLLQKIKSGVGDFLLTGGGNHNHKLRKIEHLIQFYPNMKFILLGDDSQRDPVIYLEISQKLPDHIEAVYIRRSRKKSKSVVGILQKIMDLNIETCYFKESTEALRHSRKYFNKKNPGAPLDF